MQAQEFEYEQFFAANDISRPVVVRPATGEDQDDEPFDDLPAPAWFRRREESDAFPACEALLAWPHNYPVEGDADLDETEAAEEDPAQFRYSEPELEAWQAIVADVLSEATSPEALDGAARPLPVRTEKRHAQRRASEVIDMQDPTYQRQQPNSGAQPPVRRDPPVGRFSAGGVTVSVWSNPSPSGGHFQTFSIDRRYRAKDGSLKSTKSLRLTDLPLAAALLHKAFGELAFAMRDTGVPIMAEGGFPPPRGPVADAAYADDEAVGLEG